MRRAILTAALATVVLACAAGLALRDGRSATPQERAQADAILLALAKDRAAQREIIRAHLPWGLPRPAGRDSSEKLLVQPDYVILYDTDLAAPLWVAYKLRASNLRLDPQAGARRVEAFRPDPRLSPEESAQMADFRWKEPASNGSEADKRRRSDFDMGHMAPNADFQHQVSAMVNTYILSNICAQYWRFNQVTWRVLEERVRKSVSPDSPVWVTTGSVFDADGNGRRDPDAAARRIGERRRVAVPTHFYKILVGKCAGRTKAVAYLLPHERKLSGTTQQRLRKGRVAIDRIEKLTGTDFLPDLGEEGEHRLEAVGAGAGCTAACGCPFGPDAGR